MSRDFPELSVRLEEDLAAEGIPASRIDLERACRDGRRARRRRRTLTTLSGAGAAGLCAALAVVALPGALGGAVPGVAVGSSRSAAATPAPPEPSGPLTYTATVPASFGWLPDNVAYIITEPVTAGANVFSARASGYIPGDSAAPSAGQATVFLTVGSGEEATAGSRSGVHLMPGPKIGGAQAYWVTKIAGEEANGGEPTLEWQVAPGRWATVDASDLGDDPLLPTVEHIARTVHVGAAELALPLQIKGLPGVFGVTQAVLTRPAHSADSDDWQLFTSYVVDSASGGVHGVVYVSAQGTDTGPLTGVEQGDKDAVSDCRTAGAITYCATTSYSGDASAAGLPTAAQLLGEVTIFGNSQAAWRSDLLVP